MPDTTKLASDRRPHEAVEDAVTKAVHAEAALPEERNALGAGQVKAPELAKVKAELHDATLRARVGQSARRAYPCLLRPRRR